MSGVTGLILRDLGSSRVRRASTVYSAHPSAGRRFCCCRTTTSRHSTRSSALQRGRTRKQHNPPRQVEEDQVKHPRGHKPSMLYPQGLCHRRPAGQLPTVNLNSARSALVHTPTGTPGSQPLQRLGAPPCGTDSTPSDPVAPPIQAGGQLQPRMPAWNSSSRCCRSSARAASGTWRTSTRTGRSTRRTCRQLTVSPS